MQLWCGATGLCHTGHVRYLYALSCMHHRQTISHLSRAHKETKFSTRLTCRIIILFWQLIYLYKKLTIFNGYIYSFERFGYGVSMCFVWLFMNVRCSDSYMSTTSTKKRIILFIYCKIFFNMAHTPHSAPT